MHGDLCKHLGIDSSTDHSDKHSYRKRKKYIPPIYFVPGAISFVPNFRILTQVVAEKSLTEKKVYRQTNRQTKTIYPLYTSYRGYNNVLNCND